jgi:hypothetical protein
VRFVVDWLGSLPTSWGFHEINQPRSMRALVSEPNRTVFVAALLLIAATAACGGRPATFLDDAFRASPSAVDDLGTILGRSVIQSDVDSAFARLSSITGRSADDLKGAVEAAPATAASSSSVGSTLADIRSQLPDADVIIDAFCSIRENGITEEAAADLVLEAAGSPTPSRQEVQEALDRIEAAVAADASESEVAGLVLIEIACVT